MSLHVQLRQTLGQFTLDAAFEAPGSGVTALFGPSGAGKTRVLRAVAGLDRSAVGRVRFGDETWQDGDTFRPPHRRNLGYVFQEASLFDHLDVARNIAFGLRRRGGSASDRSEELVDLLGLADLLSRRPDTLSGGERRRVAIARALAPGPDLLLMDEPMAGLDPARKAEILPWLESLATRLEIPVLFVSHDLAEVGRLADHLVLMDSGRVLSAGPLEDTLMNPALPLAAAEDASSVLRARVESIDETWGLARLVAGRSSFQLPADGLRPGQALRLRIAARDVSLVLAPPEGTSILNILPATVVRRTERHPLVTLELALEGGGRLLARVTARSDRDLALREGASVFAQVKSVAILP